MPWKKIVKFEIIILISGALLIFTLPILAREINENNYKPEQYQRIISGLPQNKLAVWSGRLPKIEDKPKIKKIVIDLSEQKLYAYENNQTIGEYLVSTGKRGMATPIGQFKVYYKTIRKWSKMAGLWMPYWMLIEPNRGIGIHELPEWPGGLKEGENHLGSPVSHGCIRLGVGAAEKIYNWAEMGTKVEVIE